MPGDVPPVANESEALRGYLAQQRYVARIAAYGLDDDQARTSSSASALCIGGIIKHLAMVERFWTSVARQKVEGSGSGDDYAATFQMNADDTLAALLDDYILAAAETDAAVDAIGDLAAAVPVPPGMPWLPQDVEAWSLRWVLLHLIEETARHAGHADVVRESLDGATAMALLAAAEKWPASPWITPWEPAAKPAA